MSAALSASSTKPAAIPLGVEAIGSFVNKEAVADILRQPPSTIIQAGISGRIGDPLTRAQCTDLGIELPPTAQRNIVLFRIDEVRVVIAFYSEQLRNDPSISNTLGAIERGCQKQQLIFRRIAAAQSDLRALIALSESAAGYVRPADLQSATPVQRRFLQIIEKAVAEKATDIHLHLVDGFGKLFFRKNRERVFIDEIDGKDAASIKEIAIQFCSNIGNNQDSQIGRTGSFNNASSEMAALGAKLPPQIEAVRLGLGPTAYGGSGEGFLLALRLAYKASKNEPAGVQEMGYLSRHISSLERIIHSPSGGLFISGPMGSAKTTLLAALTENHIRETKERMLCISAEDPVERRIQGAAQWQVYQGKNDEEKKANWANAFKTILRLDANALILGEIRDTAAAEQVFEMIMTGLRVFTSVHSNNAVGVLRRLDLLGIPPGIYLDTEVISGLVSQRLTPRLCPKCSLGYIAARNKGQIRHQVCELIDHYSVSRVFPDIGRLRFRNWDGCTAKDCMKGAAGLTVVAEVLEPDLDFMSLYGENPRDPRRAVEDAQAKGFITLEQHIVIKAALGEIDISLAHENSRRLPTSFSRAAIDGIAAALKEEQGLSRDGDND